MDAIEIVVMIEDSNKRREEELKKMEEMRIVSKIEALKELEELMDEVKSEAEKLKDEIKMEMKKRETEEMKVDKYIVRWTDVLSQRFDSTAFKKKFPEMYKMYTKQIASRRFSICE